MNFSLFREACAFLLGFDQNHMGILVSRQSRVKLITFLLRHATFFTSREVQIEIEFANMFELQCHLLRIDQVRNTVWAR